MPAVVSVLGYRRGYGLGDEGDGAAEDQARWLGAKQGDNMPSLISRVTAILLYLVAGMYCRSLDWPTSEVAFQVGLDRGDDAVVVGADK